MNVRKRIALGLVLACLLALTGCGKSGEEVVSFQEIQGLVQEKGYSEGKLLPRLEGKHREDVVQAWGEPDEMLSGLYGDVWELNAGQLLVLYYDGEGRVTDLVIDRRSREG